MKRVASYLIVALFALFLAGAPVFADPPLQSDCPTGSTLIVVQNEGWLCYVGSYPNFTYFAFDFDDVNFLYDAASGALLHNSTNVYPYCDPPTTIDCSTNCTTFKSCEECAFRKYDYEREMCETLHGGIWSPGYAACHDEVIQSYNLEVLWCRAATGGF